MIRYAILTAVSTPKQAAPDKVSLEHQQNSARATATSYGWQETAGPFVVGGYSRSSYTNLSDAERDIPPIQAALDAARNGRIDVLMVYSYDRLGDLTMLISGELRNWRVQLFSVSQPSVVQAPDQYDPYANDSSDIQQDVARIVQRFRINDMRRKWRAGVPKRLTRGLSPIRLPFGYHAAGHNEPPVINEIEAALILKMRDWFFAGIGLTEIARRCDETQVATARNTQHWSAKTIHYILANPFYAGQVTLFKQVGIYDPRRKHKKRMVARPESSWTVAPGIHTPLWDEATRRAILREMDRRSQINLHKTIRYPLSGLLTCAICGDKLHRRVHGSGARRRNVVVCRKAPAHFTVSYDEVVKTVSTNLQKKLIEQQNAPTPTAPQQAEDLAAKLSQLAARRVKIQNGYEKELYTEVEASAKIAAINKTIESIKEKIEQNTYETETRAAFKAAISTPKIERLPEWIISDEPALVNKLISTLCEKIDLSSDGHVHIVFR